MKLNLGCGTLIKEGFLNVDFIDNKGVNLVIDLNKIPYPFEDNSVEEIFAQDILEHLNNPNEVIKELWRIGKDGCKIYIRTPHISSPQTWVDLTHVKPFSCHVFNCYDINSKETTSLINKNQVRFKVKSHIGFGKGMRYVGLEYLFNKFSILYETFLVYIFQSRNVTFELEVIK